MEFILPVTGKGIRLSFHLKDGHVFLSRLTETNEAGEKAHGEYYLRQCPCG